MPTLIVTRPEGQQHALMSYFSKKNWRTRHYPCLMIQENPDLDHDQAKQQLKNADLAIITSANALKFFHPIDLDLPPLLPMGPGTEAYLKKQNYQSLTPPKHYTTEGVLAHANCQSIDNQTIAILTRKDSQSKLPDLLQQKGAKTTTLETYQSKKRPINLQESDLRDHTTIIFTSLMGLESWVEQLNQAQALWFKQQQIIVVTQKMLAFCQTWGIIKEPWLAENASDEAIIQCIELHTTQV